MVVISRAHLDHEHHRVLHQRARIQLDERIADGALDDRRIEQRARARRLLGNQIDGDVGRRSGVVTVGSSVAMI